MIPSSWLNKVIILKPVAAVSPKCAFNPAEVCEDLDLGPGGIRQLYGEVDFCSGPSSDPSSTSRQAVFIDFWVGLLPARVMEGF